MSSPSFHTKLHSMSGRPPSTPDSIALEAGDAALLDGHEPEVGVAVGGGELDPEADLVDATPERPAPSPDLLLERAAGRLARLRGRFGVVGARSMPCARNICSLAYPLMSSDSSTEMQSMRLHIALAASATMLA